MTWSRRQLLKNLGAWALLSPVLLIERLSAMEGGAPKRVVVIFSPNGPILERGPASGTETDFALHEWWSPLERHKSRGFFFAGLHQAGVPFGSHNEYGHQSAGTGALTARTTEGTNNSTGPSLDQFIGRELRASGITTPKRSVLWGLHDRVGKWGPWYEEAGKPVAPIFDPYMALADLMPAGSSMTPDAQMRALRRKHFVLDRAWSDCASARRNLGAQGKELLEFHCHNIEQLEQSVAAALEPAGPMCAFPSAPRTDLGPETNFQQASTRDEVMKAFTEMTALAFSCDLTRVVGLSFGATAARFTIPEMYGIPASGKVDSGDSGPQHHAWTHAYSGSDEQRQALRGFTRWYAEKIAELLDKLVATPGPDGAPLMDSTLVLWTSELGHNPGNPIAPHPNKHVPVLLFGDGGGAFTPGRFYDADGSRDSALVLHQLFVSMIQHTGLTGIDAFGNEGSGALEWLIG